jgi:CRISPR-associated protein Cst1
MKVELTGNPFVDTGLATIAAMAGCHSIDDLTLEQMKKVHGDGKRLARWNGRLKNVSMIFTINSLATHPGIKDPEKRILYYSKITTGLLNRMGKEDVKEKCESCGNDRSMNIDALAREILVPLGYKDARRYVGRDWFPLAGSLGSDAQSLPAGSRAPNICAKCLFAVHYLPLGTFLVDGRLVVFQSTSRSFWYGLVKSTFDEIEERVTAGKIDTLGSKEGSIVAIRKVLDYLKGMKRDKLDPGTSLFLWRFSNAGTGADLVIEEIPNPALVFLQRCVNQGLRNEVGNLVAKEKGKDSLLRCILLGKDYFSLYPNKKLGGASPELFQLYQVHVRNVPLARLKIASAIAEYAKNQLDKKELDKVGKDTEKDVAKQNSLKKHIIEMAGTERLTYPDYLLLFSKPGTTTSVDYDAWKFVRYYLHNEPRFIEDGPPAAVRSDDLAMHVGAVIFSSFVMQKGVDKFRQNVLERMSHGKIGSVWLKSQFTKHATKYTGFTYDTWKRLCMNENGKEVPYEFLFRLRLMWTEWATKSSLPQIGSLPATPPGPSGLPSEYEKLLESFMDEFTGRKNIDKFKTYVLDELQSGEKGLGWLNHRILARSIPLEEIEKFFLDEQGVSIRYTRLFQTHLFLANRYREQTFKQPDGIVRL